MGSHHPSGQQLAAPVWAAPQGPRAGFPEDHPLFQGHLAAGHATAAIQLSGADLVLVLGAPAFAFLVYEPGETLPPLVQVTDDPDEAARAPAALSVVADVASVVVGLLSRLPARRSSTAAPQSPAEAPEALSPITPAYLMATLGAIAPREAVIVEESPSNRPAFRRHVPIRSAESFYATASGGLGFAMPAAVGIKLADPSRPVLCVVGDGSALYAPQALWTAVHLGLGIAFLVVENGRYGILESVAEFAGLDGVPGLEIPGLDVVSLAESFGCRAVRVTAPEELRYAVATALDGDVPSLVGVVVDRDVSSLLPVPTASL